MIESTTITSTIMFSIVCIVSTKVILKLSKSSFVKNIPKYVIGEKASLYITQEATRSRVFKMPITVEEVKDALETIAEKDPAALIGISQITLADSMRNPYSEVTSGLFSENGHPDGGGVVWLMPMFYYDLLDVYIHIDYKTQTRTVCTPEVAKEYMLFILGHEIGHNVLCKLGLNFKTPELEEWCDNYSYSLGLVKRRKLFGSVKLAKEFEKLIKENEMYREHLGMLLKED